MLFNAPALFLTPLASSGAHYKTFDHGPHHPLQVMKHQTILV